MLHVNLLRWCNLIGSLYRDIGQYPMIEISNLGYCFRAHHGRLVTLIKTNKPLIKTNKSRQKVLTCLFLECSRVVYAKTIIHLRPNSGPGIAHLDLRSRGLFPTIDGTSSEELLNIGSQWSPEDRWRHVSKLHVRRSKSQMKWHQWSNLYLNLPQKCSWCIRWREHPYEAELSYSTK